MEQKEIYELKKEIFKISQEIYKIEEELQFLIKITQEQMNTNQKDNLKEPQDFQEQQGLPGNIIR